MKTSGALIAGSMLPGTLHGSAPDARTNWAGNYTYGAKRLVQSKDVADVQEIVKRESHLKALGTRHAFNSIADTAGDQISVKALDRIKLDPKSNTVTVGAGVTYGQLGPYLDRKSYAVHNLASLPHISVVGGCATGTHGSGSKNGNLSTAVSAMEMVTGDGKIVTLSRARDAERFPGAVIHLGGLGVVTKITLDVVPSFQVRQVVYENLPIPQLAKHLDDIFASGYSVSLFTDWQNHRMTQVWVKTRVEPGESFKIAPEFFGAKAATQKLHPISGHSAESCTEQMGVPGPWYERLPHFKLNFVPSSGAELQSEFFVPRDRAYEAILAVEELRDYITPHLFVTELRTIAADELWISPCYKRPSMTIHFTWKPEWPAVQKLLPRIEEKLSVFDPRPHWAKLFTIPPSRLRAVYPKMADFQALLRQYDPSGRFRNAFLDTNVYSA